MLHMVGQYYTQITEQYIHVSFRLDFSNQISHEKWYEPTTTNLVIIIIYTNVGIRLTYVDIFSLTFMIKAQFILFHITYLI